MKRVYMGLSGGVDSSVAAALLKQEGYDVSGIYMKNWTQSLPGVACPWQEDLADARAVAAALDIPFQVYDFQNQYHARVVDYMISEYQAGRTPNPDIMCNQEIKFKLFLEAALADGADMIATGHYARTQDGQLMRSVDNDKDQTYFLYRVTSRALDKSFMPIGEYTKKEVRALALKLKLPTAQKKDSQGICFIGQVGMKAFLRQYVSTKPGPIVMNNGTKVGQHGGAMFVTIGQRHGLGVGGGTPYYVTRKNMSTNTVYVTNNQQDLELQSDRIMLTDLHWLGMPPLPGKTYMVRLRHRGRLTPCTYNDHTCQLELSQPAHAVAVGQSVVLYDGDLVMGGGIVQSSSSALRPVGIKL